MKLTLKQTMQTILWLFLLTLPFLYDKTVPEVAGDIRWFATHATVLVVSVLGCIWAFRERITFNFKQPLVLWVLLGLAVTAVVSYIDTVNPFRSWFFLKHFLAYLLLFYWVYTLRSEGFYKALLWALVLPVLPIGMLGLAQFLDIQGGIGSGGWGLDWARWYFAQSAPPAGTFANKNLVASWLVAVLPVGLGLWLTVKPLWQRGLLTVILSIGLMLLLFGRSRASWLSFIAGFLFLMGWIVLQPALRKAVWAQVNVSHAIGFLVMAGCLVWAYPQESPLKNAYAVGLTPVQQVQNLVRLNDSGPRIAYNLNGFAMIADNPLTGVGIGAFHTAYPLYYDAHFPTPSLGYNVTARPQRAHNDIMQAFVEQGIPSGVLHIVMVALTLVAGWKLARPNVVETAGVLPAFILTGALGLCVNAMGDFPLQMATAPQILFVLFALMAGWAVSYCNIPRYGFPAKFSTYIPRVTWLFLAAVFACTTVYITQDNTARRAGAQHLKKAMARNMARLVDDETFLHINNAHAAYPYNARMHEFRGIIHNHYVGTHTRTNQQRLAALNTALEHDVYAANHLINKASLLHKLALEAVRLHDKTTSKAYLKEIELDVLPKLKKVAPFSHHTWNIEGLLALRYNQLPQARDAFFKAQQIKFDDDVSREALAAMGISVSRK